MSDTTQLFRLRTHHGTQVYLAPEGRLRHGPIEDNANNVWAAVNGAQLELYYHSAEHGYHALSLPPSDPGLAPDGERDGSEIVFDFQQAFEIEAAGAVIGLVCDRKYLCSEPDGRVLLNRDALGGWEQFTLIEADPPVQAAPAAETAPADASTPDAPASYAPEVTEAPAAEDAPPQVPPEVVEQVAHPEPASVRAAEVEPPPSRPSLDVAAARSLRPEPPAPRPGPLRRLMRSLFGG